MNKNFICRKLKRCIGSILLSLVAMMWCVGCGEESISGNYAVSTPKDWEIEEITPDTRLWLKDGVEIANVTEVIEFEYGDSVSSIVKNWLGMHAEIASEEELKFVEDNGRLFRVEIAEEPSAAESMAGETTLNETHYFYISDSNLLVDIWVRDNMLESEIEECVKSIRSK